MRKTFVIDTNVLLSDPHSITSFGENDVIIPLVVFEELDKHKARFDEVGRNARYISRTLDDLRTSSSLFEGVLLEQGTLLKVARLESAHQQIHELSHSSVDNTIILYMLELRDRGISAKLISKDINIRLKCDALGLKSEDYVNLVINKNIDDLYTGVDSIAIDENELNNFYVENVLFVNENTINKSLFPNQIVILTNGKKTCGFARNIRRSDDLYELNRIPDYTNIFGLKPRNKEQNFSLDLLLDPNIKLLTITGRAGCGKSLLTIASALHQLKMFGNEGIYEKIVITRPVQPLGRDLGYLPGSVEEKLDPWIKPIKDNINFLAKNGKNSARKKPQSNESFLDLLQHHGLVEIEALTYIRGRSIANAFMIIDEAQNLSIHELKTIVTRVGEGTKIILNGDIEQIDNVNVDIHTNALSYAIEKFKEHSIAGHVSLIKGERSVLATLASEIL